MSAVCKTGDGEKNIHWEIDTGADRTIITYDIVKELGVKLRKFNSAKSIVGVGNKRIDCTDFVILNLHLVDTSGKPFVLNALCYVFDVKTPNLMGNDILSYLDASVNFKDKILELRGRNFELKSEKPGRQGAKMAAVNFSAICDNIIPAGGCKKINLLPDRLPEKLPFILLGQSSEDLAVIDSVFDENPDFYSAVVFNLTNKPKTIKNKEVLGVARYEGDDNEIYSVDELLKHGFGDDFNDNLLMNRQNDEILEDGMKLDDNGMDTENFDKNEQILKNDRILEGISKILITSENLKDNEQILSKNVQNLEKDVTVSKNDLMNDKNIFGGKEDCG